MGVIINFKGPAWFYGMDAVIQLFGAIVALTLAFYGYKAYKLSKDRKYLLFTVAFLLLSLDLIIYALLIPASFAYYSFYSDVYVGVLLQFARLMNFVFITATLLAYTLLIAVYSKIDRVDTIALVSVLTIIISGFIYRYQSFTGFNLVSVLLLTFIMAYTCHNCVTRKTRSSTSVFAAFILLALGHLFFVGAGVSSIAFLLGHVLQLAGYLSLLVGLLYMIGKKKKWKEKHNDEIALK